jgi:hypothetical protein
VVIGRRPSGFAGRREGGRWRAVCSRVVGDLGRRARSPSSFIYFFCRCSRYGLSLDCGGATFKILQPNKDDDTSAIFPILTSHRSRNYRSAATAAFFCNTAALHTTSAHFTLSPSNKLRRNESWRREESVWMFCGVWRREQEAHHAHFQADLTIGHRAYINNHHTPQLGHCAYHSNTQAPSQQPVHPPGAPSPQPQHPATNISTPRNQVKSPSPP